MGISVLLLLLTHFCLAFFQSEVYITGKISRFSRWFNISEISESKIQALGAGHCGQEVIL